MAITIKDFIEERKKELATYEKDIDDLNQYIGTLLNDPKVKEYFAKKEELKKKRQTLEDKKSAFCKQRQEECSHPILCVNSEYNWWKHESYNVTRCVLCGMESTPSSPRKLYNAKKLIAHEKIDHDYWEGRTYHSYEPVSDIEEIRRYYYELYQKLEELKKGNYTDIVPEDFNLEDALWQHFCSPKENTKGNQKNKIIINGGKKA